MTTRENKRNTIVNPARKCIGYYKILENVIREKRTPIHDPKPYKNVSKKGSMITTKRRKKSVTRYSLSLQHLTYKMIQEIKKMKKKTRTIRPRRFALHKRRYQQLIR